MSAALALLAASGIADFVAPAHASTLTVDVGVSSMFDALDVTPTGIYVAEAGDDTNSCTEIDAPCRGVSGAVTRALMAITDGAISVSVNIAAGTYTENVNIEAVAAGHRLSLIGADASTTTIHGLGDTSVVSVTSGTVTLEGLTITGGHAISGGGLYNNAGMLSVTDSTISGNTATGGGTLVGGGGIYNNSGTVTISGSTISNNSAIASGGNAGGVFNNSGTLTISGSTVSGNAGWYVGGIHSRGLLNISNSTISDNTATNVYGGGISNYGGTMSVAGSTLSGNSATKGNSSKGGAIYNRGLATITNSTLYGNSATFGGGISNLGSGQLTLTNSTLSDNTAARDGGGFRWEGGTIAVSNSIMSASTCSANSVVIDGGYNVSDSCTFYVANPSTIIGSTTIGLAPLAANGSAGPWTMAIDATSSAHHLVPGCTGTDARGLDRPGFGGTANCDAGAYELQGVAPTVTADPQSQTAATGAEATFTAAASGTPDPTVQWELNTGSGWTDLPEATATELTLTGVTHAMDGYQYRAVFTNGVDPVATSGAATLIVPAPPPPPPPSGDPSPGGNPPGSVSTSVSADGSATWSVGAPTPSTPVVPSVTSPNPGTVTFTLTTTVAPQPRYTMMGEAFAISAPPASAMDPLRLTFQIHDRSLPAGANPQALTIFRNGEAVSVCAMANATTAVPDPCVAASSNRGGVTTVTVLSSRASTWTFGVPDDRIAGSDRYATSALIAERFGTANAIVIANGADSKLGLDALSANYLAGRVGAPILLTQSTIVSPYTLAAAKKVLTGASNPTIYVMGGTDSVSEAIAEQIRAAAASVAAGTVGLVRVAGVDRYATSAAAATTTGPILNAIRLTPTGVAQKTAILASGQVNADALAAGALSNAWRIPVLLTSDSALPASVRGVILREQITQLLVLGDTDRVSQAVLDQANTAGVTSIRRIAGTDRFATAAQLYTFAIGSMENASGDHYGSRSATVYLANGATGFPDALSVGPFAGQQGAALLTVPAGTLPRSTTAFLTNRKAILEDVIALGQPTTIAPALVDRAHSLIL